MPKGRGFYAVADVGCFPPRCCFPRVRMLIAAFTSLSSSVPQSHVCHRSDKSFLTRAPHPEQICDVNLGSTLISVRPAHAALCEHSLTKVPQPASKMLLFNPPLALAPLGRYAPFSSCLGFGFLVRLPICISSKTST